MSYINRLYNNLKAMEEVIEKNIIEENFYYDAKEFYINNNKFFYDIEKDDEFGYPDGYDTIEITREEYTNVCLSSRKERLESLKRRIKEEEEELAEKKLQEKLLEESNTFFVVLETWNGVKFDFQVEAKSKTEALEKAEILLINKTKHWKCGACGYEKIINIGKCL